APRPTPPPQPRRPQVAEQAPVQPYAPPAAPVAPVAPTPAPAAAPARASSVPPSYVGMIQAALARVQRYPMGARARRAEGVVMMRFTLARDGRVVTARMVRSSGDEDLDAEAEAMLQRVNMPPLPSDWGEATMDLVVPIRFSLRR
ncbi:energy transducer TonB, partial [Roseomonas chloroacetimidivorans]|uniref:energy transducer TonB n=1 Tax=Roseomonas chloroacetimidivorans TaxID=1766656 RepID=UPI003C73468A